MKNNYNTIAGYYDFLSRTIFQRSIINAQVALLSYIKPNSTVLIVGGGTGWILEKIEPAGLEITYVEISENMLALSRKRKLPIPSVRLSRRNNSLIKRGVPIKQRFRPTRTTLPP